MRILTRQVWIFSACGIIITTVNGCWAARERITLAHWDRHLPVLEKGATLADVEHAFDWKATHQFTIEHEGKCFVCVSVLWPPCWYYAVLIDGKLEKIVKPPSRKAEEIRIGGRNVSRTLPWRPEEEAEKVLAAEDLFGSDLIASVHRRYPYLRNSNLAGGEYILGPIMAIGYLLYLPTSLREQALAERFSPFKLKLGMTAGEVEAIFQKPVRTLAQNRDELVHIYGCDPSSSDPPPDRITYAPWVAVAPSVAVVFRDGRVNRIFSHGFFNKEMYLPADLHIAHSDIRRE